MISKNWMKALTVFGGVVAVAAAMPAISEARTHYTGKTPASVTMMASGPIIPPASMTTTTQVSTKHKHKKVKHKKVSTATTAHKKHKAKKKTV